MPGHSPLQSIGTAVAHVFADLGVPAGQITLTEIPPSPSEHPSDASFRLQCHRCHEFQDHRHGYLLPAVGRLVRVFAEQHRHGSTSGIDVEDPRWYGHPLLSEAYQRAEADVRATLGIDLPFVLTQNDVQRIATAPDSVSRQLAVNQVTMRLLDQVSQSTASPGLRELRGATNTSNEIAATRARLEERIRAFQQERDQQIAALAAEEAQHIRFEEARIRAEGRRMAREMRAREEAQRLRSEFNRKPKSRKQVKTVAAIPLADEDGGRKVRI